MTYQLSNGKKRTVWVDDAYDLYNAFYNLTDIDGADLGDDGMLRLEAEGRHRVVFINKNVLDYVSMPTHRYEEGSTDTTAEGID